MCEEDSASAIEMLRSQFGKNYMKGPASHERTGGSKDPEDKSKKPGAPTKMSPGQWSLCRIRWTLLKG